MWRKDANSVRARKQRTSATKSVMCGRCPRVKGFFRGLGTSGDCQLPDTAPAAAQMIAPKPTMRKPTRGHSPAAASNLAISSAHEKIAATLIGVLPLRALHLHPVAFARFVG